MNVKDKYICKKLEKELQKKIDELDHIFSNLVKNARNKFGINYKKIYIEGPPKDISSRKYDVIISGAGPGGMLMGAYLVGLGNSVLVVEKNTKEFSAKEWNLSHQTIKYLYKTGIFSHNEINSLLLDSHDIGVVDVFDDKSKTIKRFTQNGILDKSIPSYTFLQILHEKIIADVNSTVLYSHEFTDFKIDTKTHKKYVVLKNLNSSKFITLETQLLCDAQGCLSEFNALSNLKRTNQKFCQIIGVTFKLKGDMANKVPLYNSQRLGYVLDVFPPCQEKNKNQVLWEWLPSIKKNGSVFHNIYRFVYVSDMKFHCKKFLDNSMQSIEKYIHSKHTFSSAEIDTSSIHFLYGFIPQDMNPLLRKTSPVDGVLLIGENAGISPFSNCGFTAILQSLETIGNKINYILKKKDVSLFSQKKLNTIRPSGRQRFSWEYISQFVPLFQSNKNKSEFTIIKKILLMQMAGRFVDEEVSIRIYNGEMHADTIFFSCLKYLRSFCSLFLLHELLMAKHYDLFWFWKKSARSSIGLFIEDFLDLLCRKELVLHKINCLRSVLVSLCFIFPSLLLSLIPTFFLSHILKFAFKIIIRN